MNDPYQIKYLKYKKKYIDLKDQISKLSKYELIVHLRTNGLLLEFASDSLKADEDVVIAAIKENPRALLFISFKLHDNIKVFIAAVTQNGYLLEWAPDTLKDNEDVVLEAVNNKGSSLRFASERLKDNEQVVLTAVKQDGSAIDYTSDKLKGNERIVLAAVEQYGPALTWASDELQIDPKTIFTAVTLNEQAKQYVIKAFTEGKPKIKSLLDYIAGKKFEKYIIERIISDLDYGDDVEEIIDYLKDKDERKKDKDERKKKKEEEARKILERELYIENLDKLETDKLIEIYHNFYKLDYKHRLGLNKKEYDAALQVLRIRLKEEYTKFVESEFKLSSTTPLGTQRPSCTEQIVDSNIPSEITGLMHNLLYSQIEPLIGINNNEMMIPSSPRAYWGTSKDKYIFTTLILNKIVKNPIYKLRDGVNLIFNKKILTQFKIKDDYYGKLGWTYGNINKTQLDQFKLDTFIKEVITHIEKSDPYLLDVLHSHELVFRNQNIPIKFLEKILFVVPFEVILNMEELNRCKQMLKELNQYIDEGKLNKIAHLIEISTDYNDVLKDFNPC